MHEDLLAYLLAFHLQWHDCLAAPDEESGIQGTWLSVVDLILSLPELPIDNRDAMQFDLNTDPAPKEIDLSHHLQLLVLCCTANDDHYLLFIVGSKVKKGGETLCN